MQHIALKSFPTQTWLFIFICVHVTVWTLLPAFVRDNLPLDAIEGTIWGHQLQWGYDKNPFLNGWLTALATHWSETTGWVIYLFSQLSVAFCFVAVWYLAKSILPPLYALISVLILEGAQYYHFHAIDFNDNTLELGLWALTIYFFYKALRSPTYMWWLVTGILAALGLMAKYYTAALLTAMVLFLFWHAESRKQLTTLPPYLGLASFLILILPHTVWLFFHDFITVKYVFTRASSEPHWTNYFFFPLQFAWQQAQVFLPALILFACLLIGKKPRLNHPYLRINSFDQAFLWAMGLGPFLLTLLLSLTLGIKLRAGWGMPLLSLWGILLVATIQPRLSVTKIRGFLLGIFLLMGALAGGYTVSLTDSADPSSANFPGREIASVITQRWHESYHAPLAYVAGSRWVGGNIGFYSPDHPAVFIEWNKQRAPWINLQELRKKGGVFVWSITDHETLPKEVLKQFPQLSPPFKMEFSWRRNSHQLAPIQLGVALLPPN